MEPAFSLFLRRALVGLCVILAYVGAVFTGGDGKGHMWPSATQVSSPTSPWNAIDAYGNPIDCVNTLSQCLQEFVKASVMGNWPGEINGPGISYTTQSGMLNGSATITGLACTSNCAAPLVVNEVVSGYTIPPMSRILSIDSLTQITLTHPATYSGSTTIYFAMPGTQLVSSTQIYVPPSQQWSFVAHSVNMKFLPNVNGPGWLFDSYEGIDFRWLGGEVVYIPSAPTGLSCPIVIQPKNGTAFDSLLGGTESNIFFSNVATGAGAFGVWCADFSYGGIGGTFGSHELNGSDATSYGFIALQAGANPIPTAMFSATLNFDEIHEVNSVGLSLGVNSTNQTAIKQSTFNGTIMPNAGGICAVVWGSYNHINGNCSNLEAGGTLAQGLAFGAGANYNHYDFDVVGVGNPTLNLNDSGVGNKGWLN